MSRREPRATEALLEFYGRMERATRQVSYSDFVASLSSRDAGRYLLALDRWLVRENDQAAGRDYYWRSTLLNAFFPDPRQEQVDLEYAAERDPGNVDIWVSLGHMALARKRWHEAIEFYELGIKAAPTNFYPWYGKALVFLEQGRYEEGLRSINVAIGIHPHHPLGYETRGRIYGKMGELDLALSDLNHVLRSNAADFETRRLIDQLWVRLQWKKLTGQEKPPGDDHR